MLSGGMPVITHRNHASGHHDHHHHQPHGHSDEAHNDHNNVTLKAASNASEAKNRMSHLNALNALNASLDHEDILFHFDEHEAQQLQSAWAVDVHDHHDHGQDAHVTQADVERGSGPSSGQHNSSSSHNKVVDPPDKPKFQSTRSFGALDEALGKSATLEQVDQEVKQPPTKGSQQRIRVFATLDS